MYFNLISYQIFTWYYFVKIHYVHGPLICFNVLLGEWFLRKSGHVATNGKLW